MSAKNRTASSLRVYMLGSSRLEVDGTPIPDHHWPRPKAKLLVQLLALQPKNQLHSLQIMDLWWPELEPKAAARNLHKVIHLARRTLEPSSSNVALSQFILNQSQQVILSAPDSLWIDTEVFEEKAREALKGEEIKLYEAALALYRGPLLPEVLYEDWVVGPRERLRAYHRRLLIKLAQLYHAGKQFQRSIELLTEVVTHDPSDEETHRRLMRLRMVTGSKFEALEQYKQCREAIHRELDAEPEETTIKLARQILLQQALPTAGFGNWDDAESCASEHAAVRQEEGRAAKFNDRLRHERGAPQVSLAILPLINRTSNPNLEYMAGSITESLINSFSQLPELNVTAHSRVLCYRGRSIKPQEIGRELDVRTLLVGMLVEEQKQQVIKAELIDVATSAHLWRARFRQTPSEVLAAQRQVASVIRNRVLTGGSG